MGRSVGDHKNYGEKLRCYRSYNQPDCGDLLQPTELAYSSSSSPVTEELEVSTFDLDLGWTSKTPLILTSGTEITVHRLEEVKTKLDMAIPEVQVSNKMIKAR